MLPSFFPYDICDGLTAHRKSEANFLMGHCSCKRTNFLDLTFSQSRIPMLVTFLSFTMTYFKSKQVGVFVVIAAGKIFEVFGAAIRLNAVLMVYLFSLWNRTEKSHCHKNMDALCIALAKVKMEVFPFSANGRSKNPVSLLVPNPAKIRSLIPAFVSRDFFPYFNGRISFRHVGCLLHSICLGPLGRATVLAARSIIGQEERLVNV